MLPVYIGLLGLYLLIGIVITYVGKEEWLWKPFIVLDDFLTTLFWFPVMLLVLIVGLLQTTKKY